MTDTVNPVCEVDKIASFDEFEMTLGDSMRGERATLGKSLEDAASDLKMKTRQLEAIENSDASVFRTASFVSGYIRSYAKYLGLDPQKCFEQFCEESGFDGVHIALSEEKKTKKPIAAVSATKMAMMNDPLFNPRVPNTPKPASFFERISFAGILSTGVLVGLLGAIGFGGWFVLQEVQRVQFAPVNETPSVSSQVAGLTAGSLTSPVDQTSGLEFQQPENASLEKLYRPQELEIPKLVARDGPIGTIDPNIETTLAALSSSPEEISTTPIVLEEGPPTVDILAVRPAWIRVFQKKGGVLFEKTLDAGQRYRVPADIALPMLRAGNSGSVYVMVGKDAFGPVGFKTGVARRVSLLPIDIKEKYQAAELEFNEELQRPVNLPIVAEITQE